MSLQSDLDVALEETLAENPDLSADEVYADLFSSLVWSGEYKKEEVRETARTQLGYMPHEHVARYGHVGVDE